MSVSKKNEHRPVKLDGLVEETKKLIEKGNRSPGLPHQDSIKVRTKNSNGKDYFLYFI